MVDPKLHDLHDFIQQLSSEMSSEYRRIQRRAAEDPGTAGDQGEENWATLLRGWLPGGFHVVTKGRIINPHGETSPQLDVLVLKPSYPRRLLDRKLYLGAGVAAAFECKTTLKAAHIAEATGTAAAVKRLFAVRTGTPYRELHAPIFFGLLAHSHSWKRRGSDPESLIDEALEQADYRLVQHPRERLDLLCVADLGTWASTLTAFMPAALVQRASPPGAVLVDGALSEGIVLSGFVAHLTNSDHQSAHFSPIGVLVSDLSTKLAWEHDALRDLAEYYVKANMAGLGRGSLRQWPLSIYTPEVAQRVLCREGVGAGWWSEWREMYG